TPAGVGNGWARSIPVVRLRAPPATVRAPSGGFKTPMRRRFRVRATPRIRNVAFARDAWCSGARRGPERYGRYESRTERGRPVRRAHRRLACARRDGAICATPAGVGNRVCRHDFRWCVFAHHRLPYEPPPGAFKTPMRRRFRARATPGIRNVASRVTRGAPAPGGGPNGSRWCGEARTTGSGVSPSIDPGRGRVDRGPCARISSPGGRWSICLQLRPGGFFVRNGCARRRVHSWLGSTWMCLLVYHLREVCTTLRRPKAVPDL
ncbi:MAG: hypothetical protein QOH21_2469, partial [Acidobacteriota bacterium]|nr:hypothetical protein [Acidobacteriota bacterium]